MEASENPVKVRRKQRRVAAFLGVFAVIWYFWTAPPDLLKRSHKLLQMWDSTGRFVYGGRISTSEILLLRVVDSKPVETFALKAATGELRPLTALAATLNKHSAPESISINSDGHTILWGNERQAGITDVDGTVDQLIASIPAPQKPPRGSISTWWSPDGSKWLLVQFECGTDRCWPKTLILGSRGHTIPDDMRTDQQNWNSLEDVRGVTDDGVVVGSDVQNRVTGVHMENNTVTPLLPPAGPRGFDETTISPASNGKELWILRSVRTLRDTPVLSYFDRWTDRWDSQTITVYVTNSEGQRKRLIGVIGPTPEQYRRSGNGTLGMFQLSPDGHNLDFEWDGWLYTSRIDNN